MFIFKQCFAKIPEEEPEILETKLQGETFVIVEDFEEFKEKIFDENKILKDKIEELSRNLETQDIKFRKLESTIRKNSKRLSRRVETPDN